MGGAALLADVGGTNARFALGFAGGRPRQVAVLATADHEDLTQALRTYLQDHAGGVHPAAAAVCVAGPVVDGKARLTNCPWEISTEALREAAGCADALLVNDFAAVAAALARLQTADLRVLNRGEPAPDAPRGVLGPGTGLGVSAAVPAGSGASVTLSGEGGHVSLAAADAREDAVLGRLRDRFGHVSVERVCSGPGLSNLYRALAELDGTEAEERAPATIAAAAHDGSDPRAVETVRLFTGWLGAAAGDLALTLGARGGIYVAGGIVPRWGERFAAQCFRERFVGKGRFRGWLARVPAWMVTHPHPALVGLAALACR